MALLPPRTYVPTITKFITHACKLITRSRPVIVAAVLLAAPGDVSAINTAMDALQGMCSLWQSVLEQIEAYYASH